MPSLTHLVGRQLVPRSDQAGVRIAMINSWAPGLYHYPLTPACRQSSAQYDFADLLAAWAQRVVATVPVGDPSVFTICGEGGRGGVRGWGRPLGLALDACRPGPQRSPGSRPARRAVAAGDAEQPGGRRGGPGTLRGAPAGR